MMLFERERDRTRETIAMAVGAGVAMAAGVLAWQWYRGGRRGVERQLEGALGRLEEDVVQLLRQDERIAHQSIEVAALASGIVELSGAVETQDDAARAVAAAQRGQGVRTVLNRLDVLEEVERLEENRAEPDGPGTSKADARWLGVGVGIGRRRQGFETDPDRRDDKIDMISHELGVSRVVEESSEILDKIPNATEGSATGAQSAPDDRGTIGETSHRRTGNANPFPQDLDTGTPTHENVPPGDELKFEETGLEGELNERHLTDHS